MTLRAAPLRRVIGWNWFIASSGSAVSSLVALAALALTARTLDPNSFGVFVLVQSYVRLIAGLACLHTWQGIVRFGVNFEQGREKEGLFQLFIYGLAIDACASFAGFVVCIFGLVAYASFFNVDRELIWLAAAYSITLLGGFSSTATGVLQLRAKFSLVGISMIAASVFKCFGISALILLGFADLFTLTAIWLVGDLLFSVVLIAFSVRELNKNGHPPLCRSSLSVARGEHPGFLSYVLTASLAGSLRLSIEEADSLIVGAVAGPSAAGFFQLGKRFASIIPRLAFPMYQAVYPEVARLWAEGELSRFKSAIIRVNLSAGLVGLVCLAAAYLAGGLVLELAAGGEYADPAREVLVAQVGAYVFLLAGLVLGPAILAMGRPEEILKTNVFASAWYYGSIYWLVSWLGPLGACLSHLGFHVISLARMGHIFASGTSRHTLRSEG